MQRNKLTATNDEWKISCERFVGFLDIMGFKYRLLRDGHEAISRLLDKMLHSLQLTKKAGIISKNFDDTILDFNLTDQVVFSDTILIYSKDCSPVSFISISSYISAFMGLCHNEGIPIKGFLSAGDFHADKKKSKFFGLPLVDAYLNSEQLFFYGIPLDHNAEKIYNSYKTNDKRSRLITEYNCPFKGCKVKHLTLNWSDFLFNSGETPTTVIEKLRFTVSGTTRKYVDNTQEYLEHCYNISRQEGLIESST